MTPRGHRALAGFVLLACLGGVLGALDTQANWPVPSVVPWSGASPHDEVWNPYTRANEALGCLFIEGGEGDPVVAIEDGVVTHATYGYQFDLWVSYSDKSAEALAAELGNRAGFDPRALGIDLAITSGRGEVVYYTGLAADRPLPPTGTRVARGQVLGSLGHALPHRGPALVVSGANDRGTNRLLAALGAPYPPLPEFVPRSRDDVVTRSEAQRDLAAFWRAVEAYYPGLGFVPQAKLDRALEEFRSSLPGRQTLGEWAALLRRFQGTFGDNHLSISAPQGPRDARYLPVAIGAFDGALVVVASVAPEVPVGSRIARLDGVPAAQVIEALWAQGGRSDGGLGAWERETLARNLGGLWAGCTPHRVGDLIPVVLEGGRTTTLVLGASARGLGDWWVDFDQRARLRGSAVPGFEDTPRVILRRLDADTDALTLGSFDLDQTEEALISRYFDHPVDRLIVDLRYNPGGSEEVEWRFVGHFVDHPVDPYVFKTVVSRRLSPASGATNFVEGDDSTLGAFVSEDGQYRLRPAKEALPASGQPYRGRLVVVTNGMTGSAAFDAARLLRAEAGAVLVGRPGPHGTNRMVAEKFARVRLPSGIECRIPLVLIVTEPGGDVGPPRPQEIDVPVPLTPPLASGEAPEWQRALEAIASWPNRRH